MFFTDIQANKSNLDWSRVLTVTYLLVTANLKLYKILITHRTSTSADVKYRKSVFKWHSINPREPTVTHRNSSGTNWDCDCLNRIITFVYDTNYKFALYRFFKLWYQLYEIGISRSYLHWWIIILIETNLVFKSSRNTEANVTNKKTISCLSDWAFILNTFIFNH